MFSDGLYIDKFKQSQSKPKSTSSSENSSTFKTTPHKGKCGIAPPDFSSDKTKEILYVFARIFVKYDEKDASKSAL